MLASKHRQIGNKKLSLVTEKNQRLLNENESQNSNSYGQLPPADLGGKGSIRDHRNSAAPKIINRIRGDRVQQY
jgi:hypothetical protein